MKFQSEESLNFAHKLEIHRLLDIEIIVIADNIVQVAPPPPPHPSVIYFVINIYCVLR